MSDFERPPLTELVGNSRVRVETALRDVPPDELAGYELRRGDPTVLATVVGMAEHELYGVLKHYSNQLFTRSCDVDHLEIDAAEWGITRKVAAKASGLVDFTGSDGAVISVGVLLRRDGDDARFVVTEQATIAGGAASAKVEAEETGKAGNTDASKKMYLVSPVIGVQSPGTVEAGGLSGGADQESDGDLRKRVLFHKANPPEGGADADYVIWARACAGVGRAYCYENRMGPGTVGVTFLMNDPDNVIPTAADVQTVEDYIQGIDDNGNPTRRPTCATVYVFALNAAPLNFTISLTAAQGTDLSAAKAAVEAELKDLIFREAEPEGELLISHIREAISIAAGEYDHTLTAPTANVQAGAGEIITMGTITWS
jgi:uncharacterized phage protein gp47/JayE